MFRTIFLKIKLWKHKYKSESVLNFIKYITIPKQHHVQNRDIKGHLKDVL